MKHTIRLFILILAWVGISFNVMAQPVADAVLGIWENSEKTGQVEIIRKDDNKYYGKLVSLKVPDDAEGKPKTDINNPDESFRQRPIIGLEMLRAFTFDGGNVWEDGKIYDPDAGKDYSCKMTLTDANTLEVRGYIGISLLGRTDVWTRSKEQAVNSVK